MLAAKLGRCRGCLIIPHGGGADTVAQAVDTLARASRLAQALIGTMVRQSNAIRQCIQWGWNVWISKCRIVITSLDVL